MATAETAVEPKQPKPAAGPSFLEELGDCWRQFPEKPLFFFLLVPWLLMFQFLGNSTFGYVNSPSLFSWMYEAYHSPFQDDDHGTYIPFIVLGLAWWKRKELKSVQKCLWWPGLVILTSACLLHLVGYLVQQPRLSVAALFWGIYGMMGIAWGPRFLKAAFFPYLLFVFCVPIGSLSSSITFPLRMLVAKVSAFLAGGLGVDVIRDGSRIFNAKGTFQYDVAPACSGIRSLISLLVLSVVYGFVVFRRWWPRGVMILAVAPLAVAGNVLRITTVIIVGQAFGQDAGVRIENKLGFVTFAVALSGMFCLSWVMEKMLQKKTAHTEAQAA